MHALLRVAVADQPSQRSATFAHAGRAMVWGLVFAGFLAYASAFRDTYIDDTYITLVYARNLAEHLSWGFFPDRTTNTATSPLNVIVLAAFDRVLPGAAVDAVAWSTAAIWTMTLWVLLRISRCLLGRPHFGLFACAALVTNPLLLSAIGLEGYLYALLMLASIALFLERRWRLLGVALALLTLTRPDGVLLVGLLLLLQPARFKDRGQTVLAFGVTVLPWYLFAWFHLGSVVPDTLIIKLEETAWGATTFADGFDLFRDRFKTMTLASLWPLAFTPFALLPTWRAGREARLAIAALVAYAVTHFAAYVAMAVPPYHWYYTHQIVPIVAVGSLGAAYLLRGLAGSPARADRWAAIAATVLPATLLGYLAYDVGWPFGEAPIHSNWATPAQYRTIGLWLRNNTPPSAVIELQGEIGTVAYYSERYLVDEFADVNRTNDAITTLEDEASPIAAALLSANFLWREDEEALPPPTHHLVFDPVDGGEVPPEPGPEIAMTWDVSSHWIGWTRISLQATAQLTIVVQVSDAEGAVLPPAQQPELCGTYDLYTLAGGGPLGGQANGRWVNNRSPEIPIAAFSTVQVRIQHQGYHEAVEWVILRTGKRAVALVLTPLPPSADRPSNPSDQACRAADQPDS